MKRILQFAFLLVAMILLSAGAFAQSIASAQLSGTVKDPKGAVVPGATVIAQDTAKNFGRSAVSDANGDYQLLQLPPGLYTITVDAKGFAKYRARSLALNVGDTALLPVTLSISTSETVEVNAQAETIEPQRTSSTSSGSSFAPPFFRGKCVARIAPTSGRVNHPGSGRPFARYSVRTCVPESASCRALPARPTSSYRPSSGR